MRKLSIVFISAILLIIASCKDNKDIVRTSISGSWVCEEFNQTNGVRRNYIVEIDPKVSSTTTFVLSNFYNVDPDEFVFANLQANKLSISQMALGFSQVIVNSGTGTVSADFKRIDFEYSVFDGQNYTIKATYTRP